LQSSFLHTREPIVKPCCVIRGKPRAEIPAGMPQAAALFGAW
jgi:hypothetical protein